MQLNKKVIHNQIATSIGVLAIGDVVGRVGRRCLTEGVDILRKKYEPNLVIANVENAAGGFGLTEKICEEFVFKHQIDVLTTGNHWCDKREILDFSKKYSNLIFPANMYNVDSISKGLYLGKIKGIFYAVINLTGTLFMKGENSSPFKAIDALLKLIPEYVSVIIVDFHAEATSEKQAFVHYVYDRVSLVFGTHTHCQTCDERIIGKHTGYITDLGMTGAYDSVIGMDKKNAIKNFMTNKTFKLEPAKYGGKLSGIYARLEIKTGQCSHIERVQLDLDKE